jgi:hypothetical protein
MISLFASFTLPKALSAHYCEDDPNTGLMPEQILLKNDSQEHSTQQQFKMHLVQV